MASTTSQGSQAYNLNQLQFWIHIAVPQHKLYTRELQSDIGECHMLPTLLNWTERSFGPEIERANLDLTKYKFLGLATYGPCPKAHLKTQTSLQNTSEQLITTAKQFKDWWWTLDRHPESPDIVVKIAFIFWDMNAPDTTKRYLRWPLYNIELVQGRLSFGSLHRLRQRLEQRLIDANVNLNESDKVVLRKESENIRHCRADRAGVFKHLERLEAARRRLGGEGYISRRAFKTEEQAERQRALDAWSASAWPMPPYVTPLSRR